MAAELQLRIERFQAVRDGILAQVRQVIVGQDEVLDQILIALFVGGHCLITGMPGTAKTLMVRTIAADAGTDVQADPVHAGPDAIGQLRARTLSRKDHYDGAQEVDVCGGADLRQRLVLADERDQ